MAYEKLETSPAGVVLRTGDAPDALATAPVAASYRSQYETKSGKIVPHHMHVLFHLGSYVLAREVIDHDTGEVVRAPAAEDGTQGPVLHEIDSNIPPEISADMPASDGSVATSVDPGNPNNPNDGPPNADVPPPPPPSPDPQI